jgi:hypothetical protein
LLTILSQYEKCEVAVLKSAITAHLHKDQAVNGSFRKRIYCRTKQGGILPLPGHQKDCAVGLRGSARIEYHYAKKFPHAGHGSLRFTLG